MDAPGPQADGTLYVVIPPSALFAAHWSLFIPNLLPYDRISRRFEESPTGRRIHVSGDRRNGFNLEIIRDYNVKQHQGVGTRQFPVGKLALDSLRPIEDRMPVEIHGTTRKDEQDGGGFVDNVAMDKFESVCLEVEAPGPSLNPVSLNPNQSSAPPLGGTTLEVRDCQWWVKRVVEVSSASGILLPLPTKPGRQIKPPWEMVDSLPMH